MPCNLALFPDFSGECGVEFEMGIDREKTSLKIERILNGDVNYLKIEIGKDGTEYIIPASIIKECVINISDSIEELDNGNIGIVKFTPKKG